MGQLSDIKIDAAFSVWRKLRQLPRKRTMKQQELYAALRYLKPDEFDAYAELVAAETEDETKGGLDLVALAA